MTARNIRKERVTMMGKLCDGDGIPLFYDCEEAGMNKDMERLEVRMQELDARLERRDYEVTLIEELKKLREEVRILRSLISELNYRDIKPPPIGDELPDIKPLSSYTPQTLSNLQQEVSQIKKILKDNYITEKYSDACLDRADG